MSKKHDAKNLYYSIEENFYDNPLDSLSNPRKITSGDPEDAAEKVSGEPPTIQKDHFFPIINDDGDFDEEELEEPEVVEVHKKITSPRDTEIILVSGSKIIGYSVDKLNQLPPDVKRNILKYGILFDTRLNNKTSYNGSGSVVDSRKFTYDDEIFVKEFLDSEQAKKEKNTPKKIRDYLTFKDIISILKTPVLYFEKINKKSSNIDQLLSYTIQEPNLFDEVFTVEVRGPESPLLRTYLENLAVLVDDELAKSDEIENMENLQTQAYEKVGYIDKDLETVVNEGKDFQDYFRFLLNKKDKVVITQKENEYAKIVAKIVNRNYGGRLKKQSGNKELKLEDDNISKQFYFKERIDRITSSPDQITCTLFLYVPDIMNLIKFVEEKYIDLRIAFINKIMKSNHPEKALQFEILASDNNYNCNLFCIKAGSLVKYNKKLEELLKDFDAHYDDIKETYLRKELLSFNSI